LREEEVLFLFIAAIGDDFRVTGLRFLWT
jgi:hypothetical protein